MVEVLSLGAGVQSSTIALMAACGEITPMPKYAIFADTGWESIKVYEWLDWLKTQLPFPIYRVQKEGLDLGDHSLAVANTDIHRGSIPPWYLDRPFGMLPLQCSKTFKTRVIQQHYRKELGLAPKQHGPKKVVLRQWLGISLDEAHRMKDCELKYIENRYPLIEMRMTRQDCLRWMATRHYPKPPRSSCIFCPFKSDAQWIEMRDTSRDDWDKAVKFDAQIRKGYYGMAGSAYVHRQRVPLSEVTFASDYQANLFGNECDGVCGV